MDIRSLDEAAAAAPQIAAADVPSIRAAGFTGIVNNRPDSEEPGQPTSAEIAAAAKTAGLAYAHVPLGREPLTPALAQRMRAALDGMNGPTLMFCRSGTRSTNLWALAEALGGRDADRLIASAAGAGYDIAPLRPALISLASHEREA